MNSRRSIPLYLENTAHISNSDPVDTSAEHIAGVYLMSRSKGPLCAPARFRNLWKRSIAVMAPFHDIKRQQYDETLKLAEILRDDGESLIHEAVGWMLREVGSTVTIEQAVSA